MMRLRHALCAMRLGIAPVCYACGVMGRGIFCTFPEARGRTVLSFMLVSDRSSPPEGQDFKFWSSGGGMSVGQCIRLAAAQRLTPTVLKVPIGGVRGWAPALVAFTLFIQHGRFQRRARLARALW